MPVLPPADRPQQVRVIVLADVQLYREGLTRLLGENESIVVAGAGPTDRDCLASIRSERPDVVLLEAGSACRPAFVHEIEGGRARCQARRLRCSRCEWAPNSWTLIHTKRCSRGGGLVHGRVPIRIVSARMRLPRRRSSTFATDLRVKLVLSFQGSWHAA
jgi:DNA-binding NarL/FixJ family response regulator